MGDSAEGFADSDFVAALRAAAFFTGWRALGLGLRLIAFAFLAAGLRDFAFAAARRRGFALVADLRDFVFATARFRDFVLVEDLRDFDFVVAFLVFAIARLLLNFAAARVN